MYSFKIIIAVSTLVALQSPTKAQIVEPIAFRVDADVYLDVTEQPIKQTLTLFSGGVFYDFDDALEQVTVIDLARQRILLLDRGRQVRCELSTVELLSSLMQAENQISPELRKQVDDSAVRHETPDGSVLHFGSESFRYECELTKPDSAEIASQYRDFADWSARLNALYPPHILPTVRILLNAELAKRACLPSQITRVTMADGREQRVTCKLIPTWRLSSDDQASITRVGTMLVQFAETTPQKFFQKSDPIQLSNAAER